MSCSVCRSAALPLCPAPSSRHHHPIGALAEIMEIVELAAQGVGLLRPVELLDPRQGSGNAETAGWIGLPGALTSFSGRERKLAVSGRSPAVADAGQHGLV